MNICVNSSLLAFDIIYMPSSVLTKMTGNILLIISVRTELGGGGGGMASCYVLLEHSDFANCHSVT